MQHIRHLYSQVKLVQEIAGLEEMGFFLLEAQHNQGMVSYHH
jgi:hypothetical protein